MNPGSNFRVELCFGWTFSETGKCFYLHLSIISSLMVSKFWNSFRFNLRIFWRAQVDVFASDILIYSFKIVPKPQTLRAEIGNDKRPEVAALKLKILDLIRFLRCRCWSLSILMPNPVMLDVLIAMSGEEWSGPEQMLGRNQTDHWSQLPCPLSWYRHTGGGGGPSDQLGTCHTGNINATVPSVTQQQSHCSKYKHTDSHLAG